MTKTSKQGHLKDSIYIGSDYRTHHIQQIDEASIGMSVTLVGWIHSIRDHGALLFIDLREGDETFQVKVARKDQSELDKLAKLKDETVIKATGEIVWRSKDDYHPTLRTGKIELEADNIEVLAHSQQVPFQIGRAGELSEEKQQKWRYLALRNKKMREHITQRARIVQFVRTYLEREDFTDIETPLLTKGTDEGAREFIVPSRQHPASFYTLPQSPQQFKQLLMCAGIDRYYQIAKCFRDEDSRGDRQPEFTQIDLEMAFVSEAQVRELVGEMVLGVVKEIYPERKLLDDDFAVLSYKEAIESYGTDRPDIRFGMKLIDITHIVQESDFKVFTRPIDEGGVVKCMKVSGDDIAATSDGKRFLPKKYKEKELIELCRQHKLPGLAYLEVQEEGLFPQMNVTKLGEDVCQRIVKSAGANVGDTIFFAASQRETVHAALDAVRRELGSKLKLYTDDELAFVWVTDFPMFEKTDTGRWKFTHNPFSLPKVEHIDWLLRGEKIEEITAQQYDLVLNGHEIGGGSIRAHLPHILKATYEIMGYSAREIEKSIGHILKAFAYGAPPHGGIALGLDRIVMILQQQSSIRDVIAFPKTGDGRDLLMEAPSSLADEDLEEVHITAIKKEAY